jgi:RNase P subunit RPR2
MDRTCQHCGDLIVGNAYRVTSEESGVRLLDMIVCSLCSEEAKRLRLHTEAIDGRGKRLAAEGGDAFRSRLPVN